MKSFGLFLIVLTTALQLQAAAYLPVTEAARWGDVELLQYLLANGADPNEKSPNSECAPLHSARDGAIDVLIAAGADVNAKCKDGSTPIFYPYGVSVLNGGSIDNSKVAKLINAGANINAQNSSGKAVIHNAVIAGASDVVNLLLQKGADLTLKAYGSTTPLEYACTWSQMGILVSLIKAGASIENASEECWGNLMDYRKLPEYASQLKENGFSINYKFADGRTLLQYVVKGGRASVARTLLDLGAPIDGVGSLYLAVLKNDIGEVRRLIESGISPDDRPTVEYPTPLFLAAELGYDDLVIELLKRGAEIKPESPYYGTPLVYYLVKSGALDVLKYLEREQPDKFYSDDLQYYLMHSAAAEQDLEILKWFLSKVKEPVKVSLNELSLGSVQLVCQAGAKASSEDLKQALEDYRPGRIDIYVRDCGGTFDDVNYNSSFEQSLGKISIEEVKLILKTLPTDKRLTNVRFYKSFLSRRLDLADYFLTLGADVNYKQTSFLFGESGNTALFSARTDQEIQFLRDRGADLSALNSKGLSPIWYAYKKEEVQAFMKHGLNINHLNKSGETILFRYFGLATDSGIIITFDNSRLYRDLIALGVDVTIKNSEGLNVLEKYLKVTKHPDPIVVRDLKAAGASNGNPRQSDLR